MSSRGERPELETYEPPKEEETEEEEVEEEKKAGYQRVAPSSAEERPGEDLKLKITKVDVSLLYTDCEKNVTRWGSIYRGALLNRKIRKLHLSAAGIAATANDGSKI